MTGKWIKKGCLFLGAVLVLTAQPAQMQAKQTMQYEKIGKNNETLPGDLSDDELFGLPKLTDGEQRNYHTLMLEMTKADTTEIRLSWNPVKDADGYELYGSRCNCKGKRYKVTQITDLGAPTLTAWMCTGLKENTYYKFVVRAYTLKNGTKTYIARSTAVHIPTGGKKYRYIQSVTLKQDQVTLPTGRSYTLRPSVDMSGLKQTFHNTLRYESSDPSIVTVDENGRIKAVKKGRAVIFVYAMNGVNAEILVKVP